MKIDKKQIEGGRIELSITVSTNEAKPFLEQASSRIQAKHPIKGFRPGKAPLDMALKEFGQAAILEEGLEDIINGSISEALTKENLNTYGKIDFKLLPITSSDDAVAYQATVTPMPTVKLGAWQSPKIKIQKPAVSEQDIDQALDELSEMLMKENPNTEAAKTGDKVIMDFETSVEGKLIDGGAAKDFILILGDNRMIPGFEEKILGTKTGDKVEFDLNFPADYHAEHLSGKPAHFKVEIKEILARVKPPMDDLAAKQLGMEDLKALRTHFSGTIEKEKQEREEERAEIAAIKQLTSTAEFSELPPIMIVETAHDLVHEFEHSLNHQGMQLNDYMKSVKKTEPDLIKEFEPKATERIKASMALAKLAEDEKIQVTAEELNAELEVQKLQAQGNAQTLADLKQPEYKRHLANSILNRKIISFLKEKLIE